MPAIQISLTLCFTCLKVNGVKFVALTNIVLQLLWSFSFPFGPLVKLFFSTADAVHVAVNGVY